MISIGVENISLSFGGETILDGINFSLNEGDKLGIVGVNGAGKSSLLRIITGEYMPDNGNIYVAKNHSIAVLDQHLALNPENDVLSEILSVFSSLVKLERELEEIQQKAESGNSEAAIQYSRLYEQFKETGGLLYRSKCRGMLLRFGFTEEMFSRKIENLSGGQKTRLALVKLLLTEPDIMLLDEPTNHLDTDTMFWLEDFLSKYKKTVITVSHDRFFLDRVCTKIFEIEYGSGKIYNGNYSSFFEQKKNDRVILERHYKNQQREIARIEAYIEQQRRWNRERNIIAAESREKQLAKMQRIEKPKEEPVSARIHFDKSGESGGEVIRAKGLAKHFVPGNPLFDNLSFLIEKKERVFICGPNGCGKSTLLKIIADRLEPDSGSIEIGYNVTIGYYDQENQQLSDNLTVLDEIWNSYPKLSQTEVRNALAQFLFRGDDVTKQVGVLSGGERTRLTLTKLMLSKMNLLILDEPTNHLDIPSREALENALSQFDGTILAVSHDRYFTSKLATRILSFSIPPEKIRGNDKNDKNNKNSSIRTSGIFDFRGSYEEYACFCEKYRTEASPEAEENPSESDSKKLYLENKRITAQRRKEENLVKRAKEECEKIESELTEIDRRLSGNEACDYTIVSELCSKKDTLEERLMELYEIIMKD